MTDMTDDTKFCVVFTLFCVWMIVRAWIHHYRDNGRWW